ncbi:hypothetical protein F965_00104 [Acinetobacter schindleri NIPH 900]|uniref:Uncharacterized protein n=1 Tax=Acinetobacter schindleri NIPH 900 TaxID=1217675 RepID=N8Y561_9GAMM|nr:hypothetical protein [Acinetobacter schindleri]ENV14758.1 hypothetical protein F965_00104 [Acinetobacter schindleri NIPH 900]
MSFDIGRFNEYLVQPVIKPFQDMADMALNRIENVVDTTKKTLMQDAPGKFWFGHTAEEYGQIQLSIYKMGQLLAANFFVTFEPLYGNRLSRNPIFKGKLIGYLATETNIPLLQANFDMAQVGGRQIQQLTSVSEPDIQLNMLETGAGDIANGILHWASLMVNKDGTVNPPASYAGRITVGVFHRELGLDVKPISRSFIVAPSMSTIESLNGQGVSEALQIPITLTVLRDFME